jgi:hypothetical protein
MHAVGELEDLEPLTETTPHAVCQIGIGRDAYNECPLGTHKYRRR